MLSRIISMLLSMLFGGGRQNAGQPGQMGATSGVNLADGIDARDIMGVLEQLMNANGGKLNLPAGTLPPNVVQEIETHQQANGGLSNLSSDKVSKEHLAALQQHFDKVGAQKKLKK